MPSINFIFNIPINIFDIIFLVVLALYVFEEAEYGLISAFFNLSNIVLSFLLGLVFYSYVSKLLIENLSLAKGLADALGFVIIVISLWIVLNIVFKLVKSSLPKVFLNKQANFIGGALFGAVSFFFLSSFLVSLILSFPVSKIIKDKVTESFTGKFLLMRSHTIEANIKTVFGGAVEEALNFLTIKPQSEETVKLNFKTQKVSMDRVSELQMFSALNEERRKKSLHSLILNEELSDVARGHAKDMLLRGYFSHYTLEGYSPFDRLETAGIIYTYAAENLAFAPDVNIAMDGLMKSKGHRENILGENYQKVGIGAIDAGFYGKMFVQEFTD